MNKACAKGAEQLQKWLQAPTEITANNTLHTSLKVSIS